MVAAWLLVVAALAAGWFGYGWRGLVLAATVVAFWLLLQFNRAIRTMRRAAGRPPGDIDSAVMLAARLHDGMTMMQILPLAGSLGVAVDGEPETYRWTDGGGDTVTVAMRGGKVVGVALVRGGSTADAAT